MADDGVALARRLFMHVKDGGTATAMDLSRLVSEMEKIQHERDMWRDENVKKQTACEQMGIRITGLQSDLNVACSERDRLAADLSEAHKAILPWIDDVGWLNAEYARHTDALRRIAMPGKDIGYCRDGHEIAVLIARDALKDGET